jgi:FemAB-related protein (PEP-CTERM system-associated)
VSSRHSARSTRSATDTTNPEPGSPRVRLASDQDAERWNAWVDATTEGNFYQRYEWQLLNRQVLHHATFSLLAERDDEVVGVLPLVHVRSRLFGSILCSMPFVNFGGPAARDHETASELIRQACRLAEGKGCDYLEIRTNRLMPGLTETSTKVSMILSLKGGPDQIWDGFKSKHRTNLRRALQEGLMVRAGGPELLGPFYELMERGWRDLGTPLYEKAYFRRILEHFGPRVRIFVAYKDQIPVATAFNGHFRDTVEGMWAAGDPAYRQLQPNYTLYWSMIKDAAERGFKRFHLGRSSAGSGAAAFKARWNAIPEPLFWNYHLVKATNLPALNPDNPRYDLAIRSWRRLPLAVTRMIGPPLARLIP